MNPPIASNGYAAHDAPPRMLAELHQKLDALAAQVQYLAEQAKQERQARDELFDTLMPIPAQAVGAQSAKHRAFA